VDIIPYAPSGHHDVEQNEVWFFLTGGVECFAPVSGDCNTEAFCFEVFTYKVADVGFVVGDKDGFGHGLILARHIDCIPFMFEKRGFHAAIVERVENGNPIDRQRDCAAKKIGLCRNWIFCDHGVRRYFPDVVRIFSIFWGAYETSEVLKTSEVSFTPTF
jgi:hypothetical protein